MLPAVATLREGFQAELAHIGLIACVNALMNCAGALTSKACLTEATLVGLIACVSALMPYQGTQILESLITHLTAMSPLMPCIHCCSSFLMTI